MTAAAKAANARGLAELARKRATEYRAAGSPRMAMHHDIKAQEWSALAAFLDEQAAFEASAVAVAEGQV